MGTFFKGWRRKAGLVLLVMACVLMGMWMRSFAAYDAIHFTFNNTRHEVFSFRGDCHWWRWNEGNNPSDGPTFWFEGDTQLAAMIIALKGLHHNGSPEPFESSIPFWTFVSPLTLLSAYLLLWKPRIRSKEQPNA